MDSQASKHVGWCLKKAEKEIEESKSQKKKSRHRGLKKIKPDRRLAIRHLEKESEAIRDFHEKMRERENG